ERICQPTYGEMLGLCPFRLYSFGQFHNLDRLLYSLGSQRTGACRFPRSGRARRVAEPIKHPGAQTPVILLVADVQGQKRLFVPEQAGQGFLPFTGLGKIVAGQFPQAEAIIELATLAPYIRMLRTLDSGLSEVGDCFRPSTLVGVKARFL